MDSVKTIAIPRTIREVYDHLPEGTLAQLIENQLVMSPAPTYSHQSILGELHIQMAMHVREKSLGRIILAPFDVHLDEENVLQPDLIFVSQARMVRIQKSGCYGAPDLVIEILSPFTAKYDLQEKKAHYQRHGVLEYWIIEPDTKEAWGYHLENGVYQSPVQLFGRIHSQVLDQEFQF